MWTPLHYAAYNGHKNCIKLLLTREADNDKLRGMLTSQNKLAEHLVKDMESLRYFARK